jgi:outer membrane receptor for ferrienterochelin and colicins
MVSGIRFDEHSVYGSAISPKVGLLYKAAERTRLRTSIGRAYRAPTMTELYQPDIIFGPVIFRSNPDLKPEYILSADVGIDHDFNNGVSVHTDLFYNDMTDMITKQIDGSVLHYFNTGSAESHGLEAGLGWAFATGSVLSVSYTEQRSENKDTGEDLDHIPNRLLSIGLGFSYPLGASFMASLGVTEQYVGPRTYVGLLSGQRESLQGYWRTDGQFTLSWRDTIWIGAMIENATNTTAQDGLVVNPSLGRFYSFQIGARL